MNQRNLALFLGGMTLICAVGGLQAQTVYRIVGPDGKITFSDKPPASAEQGKVASTGVGASGAATNAALPFELRQVVSKYPVTLYTAPKCVPCETGRNLLSGRGVPFTERTVSTPEDSDYFQRLTGESSLPFLTVGGQRIKGFSDVEWGQYLDAAGYPKTSQLPPAYRNSAPSPLGSLQKAPPPPKAEEKQAVPEPINQPPAFNPENPTGIKF